MWLYESRFVFNPLSLIMKDEKMHEFEHILFNEKRITVKFPKEDMSTGPTVSMKFSVK